MTGGLTPNTWICQHQDVSALLCHNLQAPRCEHRPSRRPCSVSHYTAAYSSKAHYLPKMPRAEGKVLPTKSCGASSHLPFPVGTPKYLANKMKAKGLQRLRWYCQICQKQCRDENGFKCHTQSEPHLRQLLLIGENAGQHISNFSSEFQHDFVQLLSRR